MSVLLSNKSCKVPISEMVGKRKTAAEKLQDKAERIAKNVQVPPPAKLPSFKASDMTKVDSKDLAGIYTSEAMTEYGLTINGTWKCMENEF